MSQRDYYEVLGVSRNADLDTIKKAYRKIAMQYHPDRNPGNKEAEEKFKEAAAAYDVLSDPEKRAQYDRFGHSAFSGGAGGGFGGAGFSDVNDVFSAFSDIFEDFFGGVGGFSQRRTRANSESRTGSRRGADLRYVTEISLKDVINGVEKEIQFEAEQDCASCKGTGSASQKKPEVCGTCGGTGQVVRQQGFFAMATTCLTCRGEGMVITDPCRKCHGKGRVQQSRRIQVSIPPGVDNGTRLRIAGEGEGGIRGGASGDLFVEIRIRPDERFERQGPHLHSVLDVDYLVMLLGGEVEAPSPVGTTKVKVPKGSQPGDQVRVLHEGLPSLKSSQRGDLVYHLQIKLPKKLSTEEESLLKELAQIRGISVGGEASKKTSSFWGKKK
jgi:molecular chaperone DnaJ